MEILIEVIVDTKISLKIVSFKQVEKKEKKLIYATHDDICFSAHVMFALFSLIYIFFSFSGPRMWGFQFTFWSPRHYVFTLWLHILFLLSYLFYSHKTLYFDYLNKVIMKLKYYFITYMNIYKDFVWIRFFFSFFWEGEVLTSITFL